MTSEFGERCLSLVIPAEAGIQGATAGAFEIWVPTFVGTTNWKDASYTNTDCNFTCFSDQS